VSRESVVTHGVVACKPPQPLNVCSASMMGRKSLAVRRSHQSAGTFVDVDNYRTVHLDDFFLVLLASGLRTALHCWSASMRPLVQRTLHVVKSFT
jgi:hypothetical protein